MNIFWEQINPKFFFTQIMWTIFIFVIFCFLLVLYWNKNAERYLGKFPVGQNRNCTHTARGTISLHNKKKIILKYRKLLFAHTRHSRITTYRYCSTIVSNLYWQAQKNLFSVLTRFVDSLIQCIIQQQPHRIVVCSRILVVGLYGGHIQSHAHSHTQTNTSHIIHT